MSTQSQYSGYILICLNMCVSYGRVRTTRSKFDDACSLYIHFITVSSLRPVLTGFDDLQNKPYVEIFPTVCKSHALRTSRLTKQTTPYSIYDHVDHA
jgi:hypothetical protein